jgi:hypothetical protein
MYRVRKAAAAAAPASDVPGNTARTDCISDRATLACAVLPFARREEINWSLAVVIGVTPFGVTPNLGRVDQLIEQMISLGMISLIDQ